MKYTYHEAAIDTNRHTQTDVDERHRVDSTPENTRPRAKEGTRAINHTNSERNQEDIEVRERTLDQVSDDHLADSICIDEAHIQSEGDQMMLQDGRLQVQVRWDKSPDRKNRKETVERLDGIEAALALYFHDVCDAAASGEEENDCAVYQVPLREVHFIQTLRDEPRISNANGLKHRAVPEASSSLVGSPSKDSAQG